VSVAVLRTIEGGRRPRPYRRTLRGLDQALGWPPGAATAVLAASGPPYPGSTVTDVREYVQELISGDVSRADPVTSQQARILCDLPTSAVVAELARRFTSGGDVDGDDADW
jgi:hypothetical protein